MEIHVNFVKDVHENLQGINRLMLVVFQSSDIQQQFGTLIPNRCLYDYSILSISPCSPSSCQLQGFLARWSCLQMTYCLAMYEDDVNVISHFLYVNPHCKYFYYSNVCLAKFLVLLSSCIYSWICLGGYTCLQREEGNKYLQLVNYGIGFTTSMPKNDKNCFYPLS